MRAYADDTRHVAFAALRAAERSNFQRFAAVLAVLGEFREQHGDFAASTLRRPLVAHRRLWGVVAESLHQLGDRRACRRREQSAAVPEIVPAQIIAASLRALYQCRANVDGCK
jgi:hypothetical protein